MTRDVIEDGKHLRLSESVRPDRFEQVVALIGIKGTDLAAEHTLVIADERHASIDVIKQVEIPPPMNIPGESRIVVCELCRRHVEVVPRDEFGCWWRRSDALRLLSGRGRDGEQCAARGQDRARNESSERIRHSYRFASSSASLPSSSATRFFSAGS